MRSEVVKYIANSLVGMGDEIRICLRTMGEWRCGLSNAIEDTITNAIDEYIWDNDLSGSEEEDELWEMDFEELFFEALELIEAEE